jgi:hypothetical protein
MVMSALLSRMRLYSCIGIIEDDGKGKQKGKKNKDRATNGAAAAATSGESKKKRARTDDGNTNNGAAGETKEHKTIGEYAAPSYEPPSPPNKVRPYLSYLPPCSLFSVIIGVLLYYYYCCCYRYYSLNNYQLNVHR